MIEAVAEDHVQEDPRPASRQGGQVEARRAQRVAAGDLDPVQALHGQHAARGALRVDRRQAAFGVIAEVVSEALEVTGLVGEIELSQEGASQLVHSCAGLEQAQLGAVLLRQLGEMGQDR